jgi:hypothetical protein
MENYIFDLDERRKRAHELFLEWYDSDSDKTEFDEWMFSNPENIYDMVAMLDSISVRKFDDFYRVDSVDEYGVVEGTALMRVGRRLFAVTGRWKPFCDNVYFNVTEVEGKIVLEERVKYFGMNGEGV